MDMPPDSQGAAVTTTTADRVLDVAERLAQQRGFNGFSYADIAGEVGIKTASLHYHFPTKADLGRALVVRYTQAFGAALGGIKATDASAFAQLQQYVQIFRDVLGVDRMCLCGMLAAEYATLPEPMQEELRMFFDHNEDWLITTLERGIEDGSLRFMGTARDVALMLTGALEGSMLLARSYDDESRFGAAAERLLQTLQA